MPNEPIGLLDTHFLEGRQYRVEELEEARAQVKAAQKRNKVLVGLLAGAIVGLVYLGSLPKQIPHVVEEHKESGYVRYIGPAQSHYTPSDATIRLYLRELLYTLRGISEDKELMRRFWQMTLHRLTRKGRIAYLAYQETWKPLEQREPVRIEVQHVFARSKTTYDVRWQESKFNEKREPVSVTNYAALVTFELTIPRTPDEREYNPAGIFFDSWQWSKE